MKEKVIAFMSSLISYDYMLFGSIFLIFFVLIILALLARKKVGFSVFLVIFAFLFLIITPFIGYTQMHNYLFKNEIKLTSEKKLQFTKAVVVLGSLKNTSKVDFKSCLITAIVTKASSNKYKEYIYLFKPIQKMSIMQEDIVIGDEINFKILVEPFTYKKKYHITLKANCR